VKGLMRSAVAQLALSAVPFVVAALLVQPRRPPDGACPASGEGLTGCMLNRTWAAWLTLVVLIGVGTHVVAWLALHGGPDLVRRLRARGQAQTTGSVAPAKRGPAAVGPVACGRCAAIVASTESRCTCPRCGGVAVRTNVLPVVPAGARETRKRPWRATTVGAGRRV
jgi:hypothetical protein